MTISLWFLFFIFWNLIYTAFLQPTAKWSAQKTLYSWWRIIFMEIIVKNQWKCYFWIHEHDAYITRMSSFSVAVHLYLHKVWIERDNRHMNENGSSIHFIRSCVFLCPHLHVSNFHVRKFKKRKTWTSRSLYSIAIITHFDWKPLFILDCNVKENISTHSRLQPKKSPVDRFAESETWYKLSFERLLFARKHECDISITDQKLYENKHTKSFQWLKKEKRFPNIQQRN